ncbi:MAG: PD-(D/E)XK nuclease family transposase [Lachnospiraceae bacterium]|nr:PD-(D/E)XK nuclease family transposase [Lachnospiraceae bacterium]
MISQEKREKDLKSIEEFKMFDDTFMSTVFDGHIEETNLLLRVILERDDIDVISSKSQYFISNLNYKETRLDIYAQDKDSNTYHVEVQRNLKGASVQRARFTSALVDSRLLMKGQDYNELPGRYTIFITEDDKFGEEIPAYHAENTIAEKEHMPLGDGGHIIYINGQYRNTDTPIGELMHDFFCSKADDIINPILRKRVKYLKETEGGNEEMCEIMENRIKEEKIELAKEAIKKNSLTLPQIADVLKLPLAFVEEIARQITQVHA